MPPAIEPDYPEAHNYLGIALAQQGKLEQAEEHFKEALRPTPDQPLMHFNLGLLHQKQGRPEQAMEDFRRALQIDPGYSPAREMLEAMGGQPEDIEGSGE